MRAALLVLTAGLALLPAGTRADDPPKERPPSPAKDGRDEELEALKKEVEALRKKLDALEKKQPLPAPGHQKIVVTSPLAKDVAITQPYSAKIYAHRHINISALMPGFISEVLIKEGQAVKKGQVLFQVLPVLYKAKLEAELADVKIAQVEFGATKKLNEQKVVSAQELALSEAKLARAQAKAKLAEAELAFTTVRAPFDGLVGRFQQQQGSLVKEGDVLTTLSDNSSLWAYFDVPEVRYLEYAADKEPVKVGEPVELVLANGKTFPQPGRLGAIEGRFVSDTGSIPFRADFPNPDGLLRHGQTGTTLIRRTLKNATVIPKRAAFEDRDEWCVFVIDKDDVVHRREIVVQAETDGTFVVKKGLDVSTRIVLDGVRQLRDGQKVTGYEFRKPEDLPRKPESP